MQIEAVRLLVELGANLQAADGLGRTVIGAALDFKGYHVARWLERAAGWSALHRACDARRGTQIRELLRTGADPRRRSPYGETPLEICVLADADEGARPECALASRLIRDALLPWAPARHLLFPRRFDRIVTTLLLVAERLQRREADRATARPQYPQSHPIVQCVQTRDVWLLSIVPFLPRFGWLDAPRTVVVPPTASSMDVDGAAVVPVPTSHTTAGGVQPRL